MKIIDQSLSTGKWVSLGVYDFGDARYERFSLANVTFETQSATRVAFDAVKWESR